MRSARTRAAAVGLSLAAHLTLLAALLASHPRLQLPTRPFAADVVLTLLPPLARPRPPTVRTDRPTDRDAAVRTQATPIPRSASPTLQPLPAPSPQQNAAPAGPAPATLPAPGERAGEAWRVRSGLGAGLPPGGGLGCGQAAYARMTTAQQAACDKRSADLRSVETPHLDLIAPAKRAYFDAVAKAYAMRKAGAPLPFAVGGPGTNLVAGERWAGPPGAHQPGFGCKIPFGVPKGWKPPKGGPPHALKLGVLPCYITPPAGFLTEEADIPSALGIPKS